jgi:hypothetical protein
MGLASFTLGGFLTRWHPLWGVALGAYLLTVWDLVLDPPSVCRVTAPRAA